MVCILEVIRRPPFSYRLENVSLNTQTFESSARSNINFTLDTQEKYKDQTYLTYYVR